MKTIGKLLSIIMAIAMILGMTCIFASADEVTTGTITIENASAGQTYKIIKLFDAVRADGENGPIVYTGTIPEALEAYFEYDATGTNVVAKAATTNGNGDLTADAVTAITAWANTQTPAEGHTVTATSDTVVFEGLDFGYWVIISDLGGVITVTSTNPNAYVKDKNDPDWTMGKSVDDQDVYIGQTVTYTLTATINNQAYENGEAKKVVKYVFTDTLPEFLTDVTVTAIAVDGAALETVQFDENNQITVDIVDANGKPLYKNNAEISITYTAVVTEEAVIDGSGNTNTLTVDAVFEDGSSESKQDEETIKTYALTLQKVDQDGNALIGAEFNIYGLTLSGGNGNYTVVSYNATNAANKVAGTTMITDNEGKIIIKGLASGENLVLHEIKAPNGYQLLAEDETVKATAIGEQVTVTESYTYYDAEGNVTETETNTYTTVIEYNEALTPYTFKIVNIPGSKLPETGGMGTTMFILFGSLIALCACVLLVARKKTAGYR